MGTNMTSYGYLYLKVTDENGKSEFVRIGEFRDRLPDLDISAPEEDLYDVLCTAAYEAFIDNES